MTPPRKVVVVDDEPDIRRLLETALRLPEFEVAAFGDPREALGKLPEIEPDLIVCDVMMPGMDGPTFFQAVKRSALVKDVPFIFLSVVDATDKVVALLDAGADDFVSKPFTIEHLIAKIRATLRLADRMSDLDRQADALSGSVGKGGTLPLLKFCEDHRLTGRLIVEEEGESRWAEFLGGEIVGAGGSAEIAGEDALDTLLAMEGGAYRVEQKPLDPEALRRVTGQVEEAEPLAPVATDRPPPIPQGRLSVVEVRGGSVHVQTEAENRPHFIVTTIVARGGQVLRKTETAWQHPLQRREDLALARAWIDRQHGRVVEMVRVLGPGLAADARRRGPAVPADASLLAWTVSFIGEQVREHLGSVMTVALLRRTHKASARTWDVLRSFRVGEDGRVAPESGITPSPDAVPAVAAWSARFLKEAAGIVTRVAGIRIRHVTRMMESDLERCGFYASLDAAMEEAGGGS